MKQNKPIIVFLSNPKHPLNVPVILGTGTRFPSFPVPVRYHAHPCLTLPQLVKV
ncbi:hypothetical protein HanIR_Chr12g0595361 [Helianthus annuus]|nr:hypothetical protein HanIR_Chr12g0595361 [Helianthus annuus]